MSERPQHNPIRLWKLTRHPRISVGDVQYAAGIRSKRHNWLSLVCVGTISAYSLDPATIKAIRKVVASLDLGRGYDDVKADPFAELTNAEVNAIKRTPPKRARRPAAHARNAQRGATRSLDGRSMFKRFSTDQWDEWKGRPTMPITDDCLSHFGFTRDPFDKPRCEEEVFRNTDFKAKERQLAQAIREGAYVAVMGPSGGGKTQLVKSVQRTLAHTDEVVFSRLLSPDTRRISEHSLISCMYYDFAERCSRDVKPGNSIEMRMRSLRTVVRSIADDGRQCCLIVEEAHGLSYFIPQCLKRIREAVEDGFEERLAVVLIGQNDESARTAGRPMDLMLVDPMMREVGRRLLPIKLKPLGRTLTSYVEWRVQCAGLELTDVFDDTALTAVRRKLRADLLVPQAVDALLAGAMNRAAEMGDELVTGEHVDDAAGRRANQPETALEAA